jgi:hypothetical protein
MTDNSFVRGVLWEALPECRSLIGSLELGEGDDFNAEEDPEEWLEVGMYTLASEVLMYGTLDQLLDEDEVEEELVRRCAGAIERLIAEGSEQVREMVDIRVVDHLLGYANKWLKFKEFAGPFLLREVEKRKEYYTGPL